VNAVCSGYIATELTDFRGFRNVEQGAKQEMKQEIKMVLIGPDGSAGTFSDEDGTVPC